MLYSCIFSVYYCYIYYKRHTAAAYLREGKWGCIPLPIIPSKSKNILFTICAGISRH